jgi:hypothetical protein
LFTPVAGLFAIAVILSDRRQGHNLVIHLGAGLAAALAQAALMLAVIRLLYPGAIFLTGGRCVQSKERPNTASTRLVGFVPPKGVDPTFKQIPSNQL